VGRMRQDNPVKQLMFSTRPAAVMGDGGQAMAAGRRSVGRQKPTWARMALQDILAVERSALSQARMNQGGMPLTSLATWQVDCRDKKKWDEICQSAAPWVNPREAV